HAEPAERAADVEDPAVRGERQRRVALREERRMDRAPLLLEPREEEVAERRTARGTRRDERLGRQLRRDHEEVVHYAAAPVEEVHVLHRADTVDIAVTRGGHHSGMRGTIRASAVLVAVFCGFAAARVRGPEPAYVWAQGAALIVAGRVEKVGEER